MDYQKIYDNLITYGKQRACTRKEANALLEGYCEGHHVIPLCLDGPDVPENIVFLSAREHFIAHQLLVKLYPEVQGLVFGLILMSIDAKGHRINNRQYEWIKRRNSKARLGQTRDTCEWLARVGDKLKGQTAETHQYRADIAEKRNKLPPEIRIELLQKRDEEKMTFTELHEWLRTLGYNLFGGSVGRIYHREKKKLGEISHSQQIAMPEIVKQQLITEYHAGRTLEKIIEDYIPIYFLKEFIYLRQYIWKDKHLTVEVKQQIVNKVIELQSYKDTIAWAKDTLGITIPYATVACLYQQAGYFMPRPKAVKKIKRKWSKEIIMQIVELKDSGLKFRDIYKCLVRQGIDIPYTTVVGAYNEVKKGVPFYLNA